MASFRYFFTFLIIATINFAYSDDLPDTNNAEQIASEVETDQSFKVEKERLMQIPMFSNYSLLKVENTRWEDNLSDNTSIAWNEKPLLTEIDLTIPTLERSSESQRWEDSRWVE